MDNLQFIVNGRTKNIDINTQRSLILFATKCKFLAINLMILCLIFTFSILSLDAKANSWAQETLTKNCEFLLPINITASAQPLAANANDKMTLFNLAQSYICASRYQDAIDIIDTQLALKGDKAELLGLKTSAMYHQANGVITPEMGIIIGKSLGLHREELHTRLLLAADAYSKGDYRQALIHWTILLDNKTQHFDKKSIEIAILQAKHKLSTGND